MASASFSTAPDRIRRSDIVVMQQTVPDDVVHIQLLWPAFETLVGVRGRKMYAYVDLATNTYTACTPLREHDDPSAYGLDPGRLPGGLFLRGTLIGEPPQLYEHIRDSMSELQRALPRSIRAHLWSSTTADTTRSSCGCRS